MQALWMIAASFLFAALAVCIKYASVHFHVAELVAYRGLLSGVLILAIMQWRSGNAMAAIRTTVLPMHLWRSFIGVVSLAAWFYSIQGLPLSTSMTLNYSSSVWVAGFLIGGRLLLMQTGASPHLGSKNESNINSPLNAGLVMTVLAGFLGVALMLRPTIAQNQVWYGIVGLFGGATAALAYLQVAALGRVGEPDSRVVFYFSAFASIVGVVWASIQGWTPLNWESGKWLAPVGIFAVGGQLLMTRAYSKGATMLAANLHYFGVVFATLFGMWLFGEKLDWMSWVGMAMIIGSGIGATALRHQSSPELHEEDRS